MNLARFFIILLSGVLLLSCESSLEDEKEAANILSIERFLTTNRLNYTKTNGVYHAVRTKGYGYYPNNGDSVAFWYIGYTLDKVVFDSNIKEIAKGSKLDTIYKEFKPIEIVVGNDNLLEGISKGIKLCRENELGTILFPSTLGLGEKTIGSIESWAPLAYDIFLIYVKNEKIRAEQNLINNFVASSQGFNRTNTGMWVKYLKTSSEIPIPTISDTIYCWYKGTKLNQSVITELPEQGEMIILNDKNLIEGLKLGFTMMHPSERIQIVIPSPLGYGIKGTNLVEPYTPTLFELRLDSIK